MTSANYTAAEIAAWAGGQWDMPAPEDIAGVSNDTRSLQPGTLYIAIRGPNFDGHAFVDAAFERGALGAMVAADCGLAARPGRPLLRVSDTARGLRDMARGYRRKINPLVVAVTGSAGKSTVKEMIAQCLAAAMPTACTRGNWNNDIGLPLSMLGMPAGARTGVFEIGTNHPGEIGALCRILEPDWGVLTNIGPAHIQHFGTLDAIASEKGDLLRALPATGCAVLDRDGLHFDFLSRLSKAPVVAVSLRQEADYFCARRNALTGEFEVVEAASGERTCLRLHHPGAHNVLNALMAVAVARRAGAAWETVRTALENFAPLPMRWERSEASGLELINDAYNSNPLSMRAAIQSFAEAPASGGKWLLLADMLELGDDGLREHDELGRFVAGGRWAGLIAVGPLARRAADAAEAAGMEPARILRCGGNRDAAGALARAAKPGDSVLLKGSRGMHLEEVVRCLAGMDCEAKH